jgi:hypothetical protein
VGTRPRPSTDGVSDQPIENLALLEENGIWILLRRALFSLRQPFDFVAAGFDFVALGFVFVAPRGALTGQLTPSI